MVVTANVTLRPIADNAVYAYGCAYPKCANIIISDLFAQRSHLLFRVRAIYVFLVMSRLPIQLSVSFAPSALLLTRNSRHSKPYQDAVQSPLLVMVEAGADSVVGRSWDVRLDPELTEDAGRYRKYDYSSVRDLLRVVRNKRHHFHELPERLQGLMSPLPGGFLR